METTPPSIARRPPSPADFSEDPVSPPPPQAASHSEFHRGHPSLLPEVHRGHPTPLPELHHSTALPDLVPVTPVPLAHPSPLPHHPTTPVPVHLPHPTPFSEALHGGVTPVPDIFNQIPGLNPDQLTEADLLLADPATHTHPLGTHPLLPIHPGYDIPHSHPPFNQHPVVDVASGTVISNPDLLDQPILDVQQPIHHQVHPLHHPGICQIQIIIYLYFLHKKDQLNYFFLID